MWIRRGDYRAASVPTPYGSGEWELWNVITDPGETTNLVGKQPALLEELKDTSRGNATEVGVVVPK